VQNCGRSFKKEISEAEAKTAERQKKRAEKAEQKRLAPTQLSNYKYQAPDLEVKLSDELTGNLRNLRPEGSLLEDR
jgi:nucleolar protein 53